MLQRAPAPARDRRIAIVVKGYPRLSETFIAQEILELQRRGFGMEIWSLRHPTDKAVHPMHRQIAARRVYLPEYLYQEPLRVLRGLADALPRRAFWALMPVFLRDLVRDPSPNRLRRLGQALVMARELDPAIRHIHVHYLHTPCSVVRYASRLTMRSFSFSAHAKDIWTTPDWEKREKMAEARWGVTCTQGGLEALRALMPVEEKSRVSLVYHGLELGRFPPPPARAVEASGPIRFVTVGRCVEKKGFADLLAGLALLPADLDWRLTHIGSGPLLRGLKEKAERLGIAARVEFMGSRPQEDVIAALRTADVFTIACREGEKGDRDGLPNVVLEAAAQGLPIVATSFAGVPEFVREGVEGRLSPPEDPAALAASLEAMARDGAARARMGAAAYRRIREDFSFEAGVDRIEALLDACLVGS